MYFHSSNDDLTRNCFNKYYIPLPLVEIKDNKPFFDQLVKNKQEAFGKLIQISKNDNYTTRNVLDNFYYQKYY